jgi:heat shock protein HslJ
MAISRLALLVPVAVVLCGGLDASANEPKDKVPAPAPAATSWFLERGRGIPARLQRRPQMSMDGAKLSGSTGCNSFTAALVEKGDKGEKRFAIENVALTRKLCAPWLDRIEMDFVRLLEETQYLEHKGPRLLFLSGKRQALLVWISSKSGAVHPAPRRRRTKRRQYRRYHRANDLWHRASFVWGGCWGGRAPRRAY